MDEQLDKFLRVGQRFFDDMRNAIKNRDQDRLVHLMLTLKQDEVIISMIKVGVRVKKEIDETFHIATSYANHEAMTLLADNGADINSSYDMRYPALREQGLETPGPVTPLILCALTGDKNTAKFLVRELGADPHYKLHGRDAANIAESNGHNKLANWLRKQDEVSEPHDPLIEAAINILTHAKEMESPSTQISKTQALPKNSSGLALDFERT